MSQEPPLSIDQLAAILKIPKSLMLSYRDQGLLPPAVAKHTPDASVPRYFRSEVVQALRQHPEVMDAIRRAMRQ